MSSQLRTAEKPAAPCFKYCGRQLANRPVSVAPRLRTPANAADLLRLSPKKAPDICWVAPSTYIKPHPSMIKMISAILAIALITFARLGAQNVTTPTPPPAPKTGLGQIPPGVVLDSLNGHITAGADV